MPPTNPASVPVPVQRSASLAVPLQRRPVAPAWDPEDWFAQGSCRSGDPDELFVTGAAQNAAKALCVTCPVRTECLADALDNRVEFGVWGGMTERERRALLRRRPEVTSWRRLLDEAREGHRRSSCVG